MKLESFPKNQLKKFLLRSKIFTNGFISRQELARQLNFDLRTVGTYAAELERFGMIGIERIANGKGRPEIYYRAKAETVLLLGIYCANEILYCLLYDINLHPEAMLKLPLDETAAVDDAVAQIRKFASGYPGRHVVGTGLVLNDYDAHPDTKRRFLQLGAEITGSICPNTRICGIQSAWLLAHFMRGRYAQSERSHCNMALLDPSDKLYLGLFINHVPARLMLNSKSEYQKLLGGVITRPALLARYEELSGKVLQPESNAKVLNYLQLLKEKDPVAVRLSHEYAETLAAAVLRLKKHYKLQHCFIGSTDAETMLAVKQLLAAECRSGEFSVSGTKHLSPDCNAAAACLAVNAAFQYSLSWN